MTERVGAWEVNVGLAQVTARKVSGQDKGRVSRTTVIQFPISQYPGDMGYRVGLAWSSPVPESVKKTARSMLRRFFIGQHNASVRQRLGGR